MENKGIWEVISKLVSASAQNNKSEKTGENAQVKEESEQAVNENKEEFKQNSFCKSYNPFASLSLTKPQISSKRAEKQTRTTIDLNGSKNVTVNKNTPTRNIVDLINRHNAFSKKISDNLINDNLTPTKK